MKTNTNLDKRIRLANFCRESIENYNRIIKY